MIRKRRVLDPRLIFWGDLHNSDGEYFLGQDGDNIECHNVGGKWRPKGLLFHDRNERCDCGKKERINNVFTGGGSFLAWACPFSRGAIGPGRSGRIVSKMKEAYRGWYTDFDEQSGDKMRFTFYVYPSTAMGMWKTTRRVIVAHRWVHVGLSYNSDLITSDPIFYVKGKPYKVGYGLTEVLTPSGTWDSDSGDSLYIGNDYNYDNAFDGLLDDVRLYRGILGGPEFRRIYEQTKKFYN